MRTRILASLGGGVCGLLLTYAFPIDSTLGLTPALAKAVCALTGLVSGYVGTILLDVFLTPSE